MSIAVYISKRQGRFSPIRYSNFEGLSPETRNQPAGTNCIAVPSKERRMHTLCSHHLYDLAGKELLGTPFQWRQEKKNNNMVKSMQDPLHKFLP